MKKILLLIVAVMLLSPVGITYGEGQVQSLDVGSLSVPDTPAFEVLGVSPSSVARPGSVHELATTLFSSSRENDSSFPNNLAVEFSPYWWSYHPDLTWDDFNAEKVTDNLLRTLSFSLATTKTTTAIAGQPVKTSLGIGFRASLLKGSPSKKGKTAYDNVKKYFQNNADALIPDNPDALPKDAAGNRILDVDKIADASIQAVLEDFRKANLNRVGLRVEVAGASAFDFENDDTSQARTKSAGAWIDAAYRTDSDSALDQFDFLGVFRYLWNHTADVQVKTYDIGGRIIWISSKDDFPLALSAEYVHRFVLEKDKQDTEKIALITEYRVDKTTSIFATFGQDFDQNYQGNKPFVSLFGINLAFGKGPVVQDNLLK